MLYYNNLLISYYGTRSFVFIYQSSVLSYHKVSASSTLTSIGLLLHHECSVATQSMPFWYTSHGVVGEQGAQCLHWTGFLRYHPTPPSTVLGYLGMLMDIQWYSMVCMYIVKCGQYWFTLIFVHLFVPGKLWRWRSEFPIFTYLYSYL